jgi:hypothetical protein
MNLQASEWGGQYSPSTGVYHGSPVSGVICTSKSHSLNTGVYHGFGVTGAEL